MKKAFKRIAGRIFVIILIVFAIYLLISNIELIRDLANREKIQVVMDADAANGADDLYSILRIISDGNVELRGLLSAQWRLADLDNDSTVGSNRQIHRLMLEHFNRTHIPHTEGSGLPIAYTRGKETARNAAGKIDAASSIIKIVQEIPYGEKLNLICLGSATNLATALLLRPEISGKIVCYIQGPGFDPARRAWNKNDPVTRLDLEAMDILLNDEHLEMHLLPADIAAEMVLTRSVVLDKMNTRDSLFQFIQGRSLASLQGRDTIPCPSLALTEAFLNPDMATSKKLITPPENIQRKIYVYTRIDAERMKKDLWKEINN